MVAEKTHFLDHRTRVWLAAGIFMVSLALLVSAAIPLGSTRQSVSVPPKIDLLPPVANESVLVFNEKRLLILDWPEKMREEDSSIIELKIAIDQPGNLTASLNAPGLAEDEIPVDVPGIYAMYHIVAVARLDLAGVEAYREEMRQPLLPGKGVSFRWSIRASEAGAYRGVVWLHLELIPKGGGEIGQVLLLARQIEIQVVTVLGLPGGLARVMSLGGFTLSAVLGYPFVQNWIKKRQHKKGDFSIL